MNVLIAERNVKEVKKLVRILRLLDPSINIVNVVNDLDELLRYIQLNAAPDLILVEHAGLMQTGLSEHHIQAKLVLHTKQYHLTYLAFRPHTVFKLNKLITVEQSLQKNILPDQERADVSTLVQPSFPGIPSLFKNRFFVEHGQRFLSVAVDDIAYFFSDGRFVYFVTFEKNKYLIQYRLEQLQQLLDPHSFYRINRTYIISIKSIEQINPYFGGRFKLKLNPAVTDDIHVSKKRAADFKTWLGA